MICDYSELSDISYLSCFTYFPIEIEPSRAGSILSRDGNGGSTKSNPQPGKVNEEESGVMCERKGGKKGVKYPVSVGWKGVLGLAGIKSKEIS